MPVKSKQLLTLQASIRNSGTRHQGIDRFRSGVKEAEFVRAYRTIFPLKTSLQDFHGPAFPRLAKQLISNRFPKQRVTALREILWAISRSLQFSDELKTYIAAKGQYEAAILKNEYEAAVICLDEIEITFGKSIWLYQNRMACAYISPNESKPSDVATIILDEVKENRILHALLHYARKRIEGAILHDELRGELSEQIGSPIYEAYFLAKILDVTDSTESAVSSLLFIDSQASIIDHYTSLTLVLQAAVSDKKLGLAMGSLIAPPLQQLIKVTNDRRLIGVLAALGYFIEFESTSSHERCQAIEAYTEGDYQRCIDLATKVLANDPLDSSIRLLSVKAAVACGERPERQPGICGELHDNLFNLMSANDQFFRSIYALIQMADRFVDHNWMLYFRVAVWHELGSEKPKRSQPWMLDVYARDGFVTPFMALAIDEEHSQKILNHLETKEAYPQTLSLLRDILSCSSISSWALSPRAARYQAREYLIREHFKLAADLYFHAAKNEIRPAIRLRALGGASLALILDDQYQAAIETLIAAYLDCTNAPTLLPFKELVDRLPDSDEWPNTLSLGLLFSMADQLGSEDDLSKLRLSFEQFCEQNEIYTPTQLADRAEEFGLKHVIAYLDSVWQPEVMRQTLLYENPEQIEESRIEACQVLAKIDSERSRTHKEELASRIKQQEISKVTALVEQSKIYVDIEAIKRSLRTRLKSSYAQYKRTLTQYEKPQNEILRKFQSVFSEMEGTTSLPTILSRFHLLDHEDSQTQSNNQFTAIFSEITKEFLTGDHGLNAYLSTRVRHGKLVDALRKSVMDEHLVTARQADGSYVEHTHWATDLNETCDGLLVITALAEFSQRFDESLSIARDKKIQIRTYFDMKPVDGNSNGMFLYQFSNLERRLMQSYDVDFKDLDELIIKCVDSLWEKTDSNLSEVRKYIAGTLRDEIISHFDVLATDISRICGRYTPSRLANAIARSRTATQQALENVATWFQRSEVYDRQDFDVDFPSQIAASIVNRTLSMHLPWYGPECQVDISDSKLPGRALDSLVDIFYALFENAAKYAESESVDLKVKLVLRYQAGNFHCEVFSDGKPPSEKRLNMLCELKSSLQLQESRHLAQSEGRSGFRKILVALSNPIYRTPFLDFDHETEGRFVVRFGFRIAEQL